MGLVFLVIYILENAENEKKNNLVSERKEMNSPSIVLKLGEKYQCFQKTFRSLSSLKILEQLSSSPY